MFNLSGLSRILVYGFEKHPIRDCAFNRLNCGGTAIACEEFIHLNIRAGLIVDNFGVTTAYIGEELQRQFADFGAQASELG